MKRVYRIIERGDGKFIAQYRWAPLIWLTWGWRVPYYKRVYSWYFFCMGIEEFGTEQGAKEVIIEAEREEDRKRRQSTIVNTKRIEVVA